MASLCSGQPTCLELYISPSTLHPATLLNSKEYKLTQTNKNKSEIAFPVQNWRTYIVVILKHFTKLESPQGDSESVLLFQMSYFTGFGHIIILIYLINLNAQKNDINLM